MALHRILPALCLLLPLQAMAEGSYQTGLNQRLFEEPNGNGFAQFVDVLQVGEVINVSVCGGNDNDALQVQILDPQGNTVLDQPLASGNVACDDPFTAPLINPLRYVTTQAGGTGAYEIRLSNDDGDLFSRFDISITPDDQTAPDPTEAAGRLWAYQWGFNAGSFAETAATDADFYPLVPGGRPGSHYVWKLDLNKFAGFVYVLTANDLGVDAPNSGYSVPKTGNSVTPRFPIYLGYPDKAQPRPTDPPVAGDFRFVDDAGQDHAISPGATPGVQDSGVFEFTSDADATYAILIDTNRDGQFGAGDRLLLGRIAAGEQKQVPWDGTDPDGNTLPVGNYPARLQLRLGEYHFIADDAETSGGPNDDGLTIYLANADGSQQDTLVYWDDATFLTGTTTLPAGELSSTSAGHHTWGDFTGDSIGNAAFIDTYVYGLSSASTTLTAITDNDDPQPGVDAVLTAPAYALPAETIPLQVEDADSNAIDSVAETVTVVVTNPATGEQEQLGLTETAPDSGIFTGNLPTTDAAGAGTDNDGTMNTAYGQTLEVRFQDRPDAAGGSSERLATVQLFDPAADTDGDGLSDGEEGTTDTDGDGVADYADLDVDNDGIPDAIETAADTDGDGVADYRDLDSDNDGLYDALESGADIALDGNADGRIDASHGVGTNGLADAVETAADSGILAYNNGSPLDTDGDGVFDFRDLDSDNDGLPDVVESGGDDPDGDGIVGTGLPGVDANGVVTSGGGLTPVDTDGDGQPDARDLDSDGDGLMDLVEAGGADSNGDGLVDGFTDSDGNGFDDSRQGNPLPLPDSDGDGRPDYRQNDDPDGDGLVNDNDLDDDNDGIPDSLEGDGAVDTDGDGVADSLDLDSDNDGLLDLAESGADAATLDADGNGMIDPVNGVGSNGLADAVETAADSGQIAYNGGVLRDTDADTVHDFRDLDSDNDGLTDAVEAGGSDPDHEGMLGTGMPVVNGFGVPSGGALQAPDSDGDGVVDPLDRDSDGDGLMDLVEAGGVDADNDGVVDGFMDGDADGWQDALTGTGLPRPDGDSDGVPDVLDLDSDNDGIADVLEAGGSDPDGDGRVGASPQQVDALGVEQSAPLAPRDTDGDGVHDQRDLDSDNDGIPDVIESGGSDPDGDGISGSGQPQVDSQGRVAPMLMLTDTDGDGAADPYDLDADEDSLSDLVESGFPDVDDDGRVDGFTDLNGDGFDDARSGTPLNLPDSDGDGIPDYRDSDDLDRDGLLDDDDLDDDNDGIPDMLEGDGAVDTDGDGVPDSRDLDSDNDGLLDLAESGADAAGLDADGNGRIDAVHTVGANGLADAVESTADSGQIAYNGGVLLDTDADGVADFRDLDSDNDGIVDVIENGGSDGDGDGRLGSGQPMVNGDGVAAGGGQPLVDTDGDGQPDARDLDADGDGRNDVLEAGGSDADGDGRVDGFSDSNGDGWNDGSAAAGAPADSDYDGVPDFQDTSDDRGVVETAVKGIGALQGLLLPLLLLGLLRLFPRVLPVLGLALLLTLLWVPPASVSADWRNTDDWTWYLGGGLGLSKMDPKTGGTIYSVDDDSDSAWRLFVGADLTPKISAELALADLGTTTLKPVGDIDYQTFSLDLLYYFHDQDRTDHVGWAAYAKAGLGHISNDASVPYDKNTSLQIALGLGGEYAWKSGWALRADLESYDKDAAALTVDLLYRFGRQQRTTTQRPAAEPVAAGPVDSDGDGVFDARDRCPDTATGTAVDDLGCSLDRDGDGVVDEADRCPQTPAGAEVNAEGCALFETRIEGVYFELGSARLTAESKQTLNRVVEVLKQFPQLRIEIQAHTDSLGQADSNQKLSEARARSVREYLISQGIAAGRLEAKGYGESRPVANNDTPEGRAQNRRVEFRVIGQ